MTPLMITHPQSTTSTKYQLNMQYLLLHQYSTLLSLLINLTVPLSTQEYKIKGYQRIVRET